MGDIIRTVEWEGEHTRLVKLSGLPTGPGEYRRIKGRQIKRLFVHQAAGGFKEGAAQAIAIARFHSAPPKYKRDPQTNEILYRTVRGKKRKHWIGGGRGWPGAGYTFCVPAIPDVKDGKIEVYRMHDDEVRSYHTGGSHNTYGAAVVVGGYYKAPGGKRGRERPDDGAVMSLKELVLDYLIPRYGITNEDLYGHFDAGKRGCPGAFLEQWIRHVRGEPVEDPTVELQVDPRDEPDEAKSLRSLDTVRERQQALVDLGFDLGPYGPKKNGVDGDWGGASRGALEAFESSMGLNPDGYWDDRAEHAVRVALGLLERGGW